MPSKQQNKLLEMQAKYSKNGNYRYSYFIPFNQKKVNEYLMKMLKENTEVNIYFEEFAILYGIASYIHDRRKADYKSGKDVPEDEKQSYYSISEEFIMKNLPTLRGLSKINITRKITYLCDLGMLERSRSNRAFRQKNIRLGDNYRELIDTKYLSKIDDKEK